MSSSALPTLPRLLVVDDEPMMQEVFALAFDGIYEVDGFSSGADAVEAATRFPYPVAIVDLRMEGMDGVEVLTALRKTLPRIRVIILTGHASMESAIAAVNTGAFRYLQKPFVLKEMRQCVADAFAVHANEVTTPKPSPEALAEIGITGRKADVAMQVMDYKSTKEIAASLELSPRTVEKHLEAVFTTLGISSRREMIAKMKDMLSKAAPMVTGLGALAAIT